MEILQIPSSPVSNQINENSDKSERTTTIELDVINEDMNEERKFDTEGAQVQGSKFKRLANEKKLNDGLLYPFPQHD